MDRQRFFIFVYKQGERKYYYQWYKITSDMILHSFHIKNNIINKKLIENFMTDKYDINYDCQNIDEYIFNENYFTNIKLNGEPEIYSSYYNINKSNKKVYLCIHKTRICFDKGLMTYTVDKLSFNISNQIPGKVLSFASCLNHTGEIIAYGITYIENYFELIIVNLNYRIYKKETPIIKLEITSFQILNDFNEKDKIITDVLISGNILIAVFNFKFVILIDIESFEIIANSYKNEFSNILVLDRLFKDDYNKCLYVIPIEEKIENVEICYNSDIEEDLQTNTGIQATKNYEFYFITKRFTKYIKGILKSTFKTNLLTKLSKLTDEKHANIENEFIIGRDNL